MCTFSVLYNFSIHYFPGKKTGWVSVFWNWLRFAFILIFLWMRNTQKYPFSVLFNSIFFLYKTWMSVRISKLIEVCFQKFNLIFFCKSEVQKNPFNEFCSTLVCFLDQSLFYTQRLDRWNCFCNTRLPSYTL